MGDALVERQVPGACDVNRLFAELAETIDQAIIGLGDPEVFLRTVIPAFLVLCIRHLNQVARCHSAGVGGTQDRHAPVIVAGGCAGSRILPCKADAAA